MSLDPRKYVLESKLKGMSDDAIHSALSSMGTDPAEIKSAFEAAGGEHGTVTYPPTASVSPVGAAPAQQAPSAPVSGPTMFAEAPGKVSAPKIETPVVNAQSTPALPAKDSLASKLETAQPKANNLGKIVSILIAGIVIVGALYYFGVIHINS